MSVDEINYCAVKTKLPMIFKKINNEEMFFNRFGYSNSAMYN